MSAEPRFRDAVRHLPARVWLVSAGILVNRAGNFLPIFIVLYVTVTHHSPWMSGLVLGVAGLGNVLGNAVGGHLADHLGRRWTMTVSGLATAALTACIPLAGPLVVLVVLVGLVGVASQLYRPAAAALLVDGLDHRQRLAAAGVFRFAMNIGAAIGGVAGGVLATVSYEWMFYSNALAALVFAIVTAVFVRDPAAYADAKADADATPQEAGGYRAALADRRLRRFLAMTFVAEAVYIQSTVGLPLHVTAKGLTPADFGFLIGLNGLLVLVFELPITAAVSRRRPEYVLAVGNLLTGVGLALTVFAGSMVWLGATVVLWTAGEMLYASMAAAYMGGLAPAHLVGRYQGLYGATITAGNGLGPLIGGVVYAASTNVFWALVAVAGTWSAQLCLPPLRRRSQQPPVEHLQPAQEVP
ncbi:MFS transporter [Dactylosporangium sp. CS-047395]|uniref:MFS transporter n=1 Tax=Dactylosporangium sp. CS-047395 TaxID=3239936 RepID=UPI003D9226FC